MKRVIKWAGTGLLFASAGLAFTAALLPPLLDQHYYDGPVSDHYDGARFFNPGERDKPARSRAKMARFFLGLDRAEWPARVPVTPGTPYVAGSSSAAPSSASDACPPMRGGAVIENWSRCVRTFDPRTVGSPTVESQAVNPRSMVATWIGHATVLVQAGGVNVLTDPQFSDRASPVSWAGPKRARAPGIALADLPKIDVIVVSHNHYDHMDLPSLKALWDRDRPLIVTALGNDTILARAGIVSVALDWGGFVREGQRPNQTVQCASRDPGCVPGFTVAVERNHHWGSRYGTDRNRALWSSFLIRTPAGTIYHAGDTGLGDGRWAAESARKGPIRLAILPIGAYEPRDVMAENHVNPAESVRIFDQLRPAMAIGMHWGTFQLTDEAIDAPPRALARVRGARNFVTSEVGRNIVVPEVGRLP